MTLTTVGYRHLHPTHPGTQILTIIYILTRLGVFVALLAALAQQYITQKAEATLCATARARRRRDTSD